MTTIVLVHGAFADSSSWNGVIPHLTGAGHHVICFAVPLRSVKTDAALLSDLLASIDGPIVLAGHSYGGAVLTNVADPKGAVSSVVYVGAFALEPGESAGDASSLVPGSTLGETLRPVPLSSGGADAYIAQDLFVHQFAADVDPQLSALMAVTQRPITQEALAEPSGASSIWSSVPSRFIFGDADRNIPVGAHRIMAERAGSVKTVEIPGASHVVGISHPDETASLILEAASGAD